MILRSYLQKIQLPNKVITSSGIVSALFIKENIQDFWSAIEYVQQLPFARNSSRDNYFQVLSEKRGACSTKHALLAELANELSIPMQLMLGIFMLNSLNTPGLNNILQKYNLIEIPETHTYLKYSDHTLDVTFPDATEFSFGINLVDEMPIAAQQIGSFKVERHQDSIRNYVLDNPQQSFDLVWQAREDWIAQLTKAK